MKLHQACTYTARLELSQQQLEVEENPKLRKAA